VGAAQSSLSTVIIYGGGGVGKSAAALDVAHQFKEENCYDAIVWVNAENREVLRESFNKLAVKLILDGATARSDKDTSLRLFNRVKKAKDRA
jgi:replication-associated recombination protein RarA